MSSRIHHWYPIVMSSNKTETSWFLSRIWHHMAIKQSMIRTMASCRVIHSSILRIFEYSFESSANINPGNWTWSIISLINKMKRPQMWTLGYSKWRMFYWIIFGIHWRAFPEDYWDRIEMKKWTLFILLVENDEITLINSIIHRRNMFDTRKMI